MHYMQDVFMYIIIASKLMIIIKAKINICFTFLITSYTLNPDNHYITIYLWFNHKPSPSWISQRV